MKVRALVPVRLAATTVLAFSIGAAALPVAAQADGGSVYARDQTNSLTCDESKWAVYQVFHYTVNSAYCFYQSGNHEILRTPSYEYDVKKTHNLLWNRFIEVDRRPR